MYNKKAGDVVRIGRYPSIETAYKVVKNVNGWVTLDNGKEIHESELVKVNWNPEDHNYKI